MDGNKCTKCGKVINNNTFTRCEDCWITVSPCDKVDIIKAVKLLAERVKELTDDARARQVATEDHITKLETSLGKLDELYEEINLQELKHNSDFEQRIKTLESAITHTVPYPDNSEQTRNCYACGTTDFKEEDGLNHYGLSVQAEGKPDILLCRKCFIVTPQVRNPLTRIQIEWLLRCVHDLRHGGYYMDENIVEAERLLEFYLGE